jgi:hypothetical protein
LVVTRCTTAQTLAETERPDCYGDSMVE